jgi:hypothetical protein
VDETIAAAHSALSPILLQRGLTVGQPIIAIRSSRPDGLPLLPEPTTHGYVPIYSTLGGVDYLIGFGRVNWGVVSWDASNGHRLAFTKLTNVGAARNVTGTLAAPVEPMSDEVVNALFQRNRNLPDAVNAAVLVR